MNESPMQRGAREANELSDRTAAARDAETTLQALEALTHLTDQLVDRVIALERRVKGLESRHVKLR